MNALLQDLRYGLRTLAKAPGFTALALVTMAIGTGANATVFGFINALLLRPAPGVADAGSLVAVYTSDFSSGPYGTSSYPDYRSITTDASTFRQVAAERGAANTLVWVGDATERVRTSAVSGEYFEVLGLRPSIGRLLTAGDVGASSDPVAVIGHRLWQRAFAGDPTVVGRTVMVGGRAHTIVGVAPARFEGLDLGRPFELWTPLRPPPERPDERQNRSLLIVGRLRDAVSLRQAQTELTGIAARLAQSYPETNMGTLAAPEEPRPILAMWHSRLDPAFRGEVAMIGAIIMAAVGLVLLIACANIATLLLSRGSVRQRELAIRLALGAGRWRLVRQLFTESLLLGVGGGSLGLLVALWTADVLPSFFPAEQANMLETAVDLRVLSFTAVVSIGGSLLFGLAPAWQAARPTVGSLLRGDAGRLSDGPQGGRLRRILVVAQVALAVVLLVSAGLLVQSLVNALSADPGFGTRQAALMSVELPPAEFDEAKGAAYYAIVLERLRSMSGVEAVGLASTVPLSRSPRRGFRPDGYVHRPGEDRELRFNVIDDSYFDVMHIRLLAGRPFDSRDRRDGAQVVIVNDVFAQQYFGANAVGRTVTDSGDRKMEIIGVARADARVSVTNQREPAVYYPLSQNYLSRMTVIARTSGDPGPLLEPMRRELLSVQRGVPIFNTKTLSGQVSEALAADRLTAALVSACGAMALLLAVVGVYGVIAYAVARRRREIGVRVALGARPVHVVRLILTEGMTVMLVGIVGGLAATAAATRVLASMLHGVSTSDASTYAAVPALLVVVSLIAAWAPARRALRVDPMTVLRQD
jgi:putative ABC transport system permease protein